MCRHSLPPLLTQHTVRFHTEPALVLATREFRDELVRHGRDAADIYDGEPRITHGGGNVVLDGTSAGVEGDRKLGLPLVPSTNQDSVVPVPVPVSVPIHARPGTLSLLLLPSFPVGSTGTGTGTTTIRQENLQPPLDPPLPKDARDPLEEQHAAGVSAHFLPAGAPLASRARVSRRVQKAHFQIAARRRGLRGGERRRGRRRRGGEEAEHRDERVDADATGDEDDAAQRARVDARRRPDEAAADAHVEFAADDGAGDGARGSVIVVDDDGRRWAGILPQPGGRRVVGGFLDCQLEVWALFPLRRLLLLLLLLQLLSPASFAGVFGSGWGMC